MTRQELKQISQVRLKEAKALFDAHLYDGARYLAGYAVETALKAIISKRLGTSWPPPQQVFLRKIGAKWPASIADAIRKAHLTHRLDDLVLLAGLSAEFKQKLNDTSTNFSANWSEVSQWNETRRYAAIGTGTATSATNLINALEDPTDGILTWLKTKW